MIIWRIACFIPKRLDTHTHTSAKRAVEEWDLNICNRSGLFEMPGVMFSVPNSLVDVTVKKLNLSLCLIEQHTMRLMGSGGV
jgi:hypothetical protein